VMLEKRILDRVWTDSVLLMMSSGNFDGLDISRLAAEILKPV